MHAVFGRKTTMLYRGSNAFLVIFLIHQEVIIRDVSESFEVRPDLRTTPIVQVRCNCLYVSDTQNMSVLGILKFVAAKLRA